MADDNKPDRDEDLEAPKEAQPALETALEVVNAQRDGRNRLLSDPSHVVFDAAGARRASADVPFPIRESTSEQLPDGTTETKWIFHANGMTRNYVAGVHLEVRSTDGASRFRVDTGRGIASVDVEWTANGFSVPIDQATQVSIRSWHPESGRLSVDAMGVNGEFTITSFSREFSETQQTSDGPRTIQRLVQYTPGAEDPLRIDGQVENDPERRAAAMPLIEHTVQAINESIDATISMPPSVQRPERESEDDEIQLTGNDSPSPDDTDEEVYDYQFTSFVEAPELADPDDDEEDEEEPATGPSQTNPSQMRALFTPAEAAAFTESITGWSGAEPISETEARDFIAMTRRHFGASGALVAGLLLQANALAPANPPDDLAEPPRLPYEQSSSLQSALYRAFNPSTNSAEQREALAYIATFQNSTAARNPAFRDEIVELSIHALADAAHSSIIERFDISGDAGWRGHVAPRDTTARADYLQAVHAFLALSPNHLRYGLRGSESANGSVSMLDILINNGHLQMAEGRTLLTAVTGNLRRSADNAIVSHLRQRANDPQTDEQQRANITALLRVFSPHQDAERQYDRPFSPAEQLQHELAGPSAIPTLTRDWEHATRERSNSARQSLIAILGRGDGTAPPTVAQMTETINQWLAAVAGTNRELRIAELNMLTESFGRGAQSGNRQDIQALSAIISGAGNIPEASVSAAMALMRATGGDLTRAGQALELLTASRNATGNELLDQTISTFRFSAAALSGDVLNTEIRGLVLTQPNVLMLEALRLAAPRMNQESGTALMTEFRERMQDRQRPEPERLGFLSYMNSLARFTSAGDMSAYRYLMQQHDDNSDWRAGASYNLLELARGNGPDQYRREALQTFARQGWSPSTHYGLMSLITGRPHGLVMGNPSQALVRNSELAQDAVAVLWRGAGHGPYSRWQPNHPVTLEMWRDLTQSAASDPNYLRLLMENPTFTDRQSAGAFLVSVAAVNDAARDRVMETLNTTRAAVTGTGEAEVRRRAALNALMIEVVRETATPAYINSISGRAANGDRAALDLLVAASRSMFHSTSGHSAAVNAVFTLSANPVTRATILDAMLTHSTSTLDGLNTELFARILSREFSASENIGTTLDRIGTRWLSGLAADSRRWTTQQLHSVMLQAEVQRLAPSTSDRTPTEALTQLTQSIRTGNARAIDLLTRLGAGSSDHAAAARQALLTVLSETPAAEISAQIQRALLQVARSGGPRQELFERVLALSATSPQLLSLVSSLITLGENIPRSGSDTILALQASLHRGNRDAVSVLEVAARGTGAQSQVALRTLMESAFVAGDGVAHSQQAASRAALLRLAAISPASRERVFAELGRVVASTVPNGSNERDPAINLSIPRQDPNFLSFAHSIATGAPAAADRQEALNNLRDSAREGNAMALRVLVMAAHGGAAGLERTALREALNSVPPLAFAQALGAEQHERLQHTLRGGFDHGVSRPDQLVIRIRTALAAQTSPEQQQILLNAIASLTILVSPRDRAAALPSSTAARLLQTARGEGPQALAARLTLISHGSEAVQHLSITNSIDREIYSRIRVQAAIADSFLGWSFHLGADNFMRTAPEAQRDQLRAEIERDFVQALQNEVQTINHRRAATILAEIATDVDRPSPMRDAAARALHTAAAAGGQQYATVMNALLDQVARTPNSPELFALIARMPAQDYVDRASTQFLETRANAATAALLQASTSNQDRARHLQTLALVSSRIRPEQLTQILSRPEVVSSTDAATSAAFNNFMSSLLAQSNRDLTAIALQSTFARGGMPLSETSVQGLLNLASNPTSTPRTREQARALLLSSLDGANLPEALVRNVRQALTTAIADSGALRALVADTIILSGTNVNGLIDLARSLSQPQQNAIVGALRWAYIDGVMTAADAQQSGLQRTTADVARALTAISGGLAPITALVLSDRAAEQSAGLSLLAMAGFSSGFDAGVATAARTRFQETLASRPDLRPQAFQALSMVPGEMAQRLPLIAQMVTGSAVLPANPEQAMTSLVTAGRNGNVLAIQALAGLARQTDTLGNQALASLVETAGATNVLARQSAHLVLLGLSANPAAADRVWPTVMSSLSTRPELLDVAVGIASQGMVLPQGPLQSLSMLEQMASAGNQRAVELLQFASRNSETATGAREILTRVAARLQLTEQSLTSLANMVLGRTDAPAAETPVQTLRALETAARSGNVQALQLLARVAGLQSGASGAALALDASTRLQQYATINDASRDAALSAAAHAFALNVPQSGIATGTNYLPGTIINLFNRQTGQPSTDPAALRTFVGGLRPEQVDYRISPMLAWLAANQPETSQQALTLLRTAPEGARADVTSGALAVFDQQAGRLQQAFAAFSGPPAERAQLLQQYYRLLQTVATLNGTAPAVLPTPVFDAIPNMNIEQQNVLFNGAPTLMRLAGQPQSITREDVAVLQILNTSRLIDNTLSNTQRQAVQSFVESRMLSVLTTAGDHQVRRDAYEALNRSGWSRENHQQVRAVMTEFARSWLATHPQDAEILRHASLLGQTEGQLPVRAWLRQLGIEPEGQLLERAIELRGEEAVRNGILAWMRFNASSPAMRGLLVGTTWGNGAQSILASNATLDQLRDRLTALRTNGSAVNVTLNDVLQVQAGERPDNNSEHVHTILNPRLDFAAAATAMSRLVTGLQTEMTELNNRIPTRVQGIEQAAQNGVGVFWTQADSLEAAQQMELREMNRLRAQIREIGVIAGRYQQEINNIGFSNAIVQYNAAVGSGNRAEADRLGLAVLATDLVAQNGIRYLIDHAPHLYRDLYPSGVERSAQGILSRLHTEGVVPIAVPNLPLGGNQVWNQALASLRESSNAAWRPGDGALRQTMAQHRINGLQTDPRYQNNMLLTMEIGQQFSELQHLFQVGANEGNSRSPAFTDNVRQRADALATALQQLSENDHGQLLADTRSELARLTPESAEWTALNNVRLALEAMENLRVQWRRPDSALHRMVDQIRSGAFDAHTFGQWCRTTGVDLLIEAAVIAGCIAFTGGAGLAVRGVVSLARAAAIMTVYMRAGNFVTTELGYRVGTRAHGHHLGDQIFGRTSPFTNAAISDSTISLMRPRTLAEALRAEGQAAGTTFAVNVVFMGAAPVLHNVPGMSNVSARIQGAIPRLARQSGTELAEVAAANGLRHGTMRRIGMDFLHHFETNLHFTALQIPLEGALVHGLHVNHELAGHIAGGLLALGHGNHRPQGTYRIERTASGEPLMQHTFGSAAEMTQALRQQGHRIVRHEGHDYLLVAVPEGSHAGAPGGAAPDGAHGTPGQAPISAHAEAVLRANGIEVTRTGEQAFGRQVPVRIERISMEAFYRGQVTGGWDPVPAAETSGHQHGTAGGAGTAPRPSTATPEAGRALHALQELLVRANLPAGVADNLIGQTLADRLSSNTLNQMGEVQRRYGDMILQNLLHSNVTSHARDIILRELLARPIAPEHIAAVFERAVQAPVPTPTTETTHSRQMNGRDAIAQLVESLPPNSNHRSNVQHIMDAAGAGAPINLEHIANSAVTAENRAPIAGLLRRRADILAAIASGDATRLGNAPPELLQRLSGLIDRALVSSGGSPQEYARALVELNSALSRAMRLQGTARVNAIEALEAGTTHAATSRPGGWTAEAIENTRNSVTSRENGPAIVDALVQFGVPAHLMQGMGGAILGPHGPAELLNARNALHVQIEGSTLPAHLSRADAIRIRNSMDALLRGEAAINEIHTANGGRDHAATTWRSQLEHFNRLLAQVHTVPVDAAAQARNQALTSILGSVGQVRFVVPLERLSDINYPTRNIARFGEWLAQMEGFIPSGVSGPNQSAWTADVLMTRTLAQSNNPALRDWVYVPAEPGSRADTMGIDGIFFNLRTGHVRPIDYKRDTRTTDIGTTSALQPFELHTAGTDFRNNPERVIAQFLERQASCGFDSHALSQALGPAAQHFPGGVPSLRREPVSNLAEQVARMQAYVTALHRHATNTVRDTGALPPSLYRLGQGAETTLHYLTARMELARQLPTLIEHGQVRHVNDGIEINLAQPLRIEPNINRRYSDGLPYIISSVRIAADGTVTAVRRDLRGDINTRLDADGRPIPGRAPEGETITFEIGRMSEIQQMLRQQLTAEAARNTSLQATLPQRLGALDAMFNRAAVAPRAESVVPATAPTTSAQTRGHSTPSDSTAPPATPQVASQQPIARPRAPHELDMARAELGATRSSLRQELIELNTRRAGNPDAAFESQAAVLEAQIFRLNGDIVVNLQQRLSQESVLRMQLERDLQATPNDVALQNRYAAASAIERRLTIGLYLERGLMPPTLSVFVNGETVHSSFRIRDVGHNQLVATGNIPLIIPNVVGSGTIATSIVSAVMYQMRLNRVAPSQLTMSPAYAPAHEQGSRNSRGEVDLQIANRPVRTERGVFDHAPLAAGHHFNHEMGHALQGHFDGLAEGVRNSVLETYRAALRASDGAVIARTSQPLWQQLINGSYSNLPLTYFYCFPEMLAEMHALHRLSTQLRGNPTYVELLQMRTAQYQADRHHVMLQFEPLYQALVRDVFRPLDALPTRTNSNGSGPQSARPRTDTGTVTVTVADTSGLPQAPDSVPVANTAGRPARQPLATGILDNAQDAARLRRAVGDQQVQENLQNVMRQARTAEELLANVAQALRWADLGLATRSRITTDHWERLARQYIEANQLALPSRVQPSHQLDLQLPEATLDSPVVRASNLYDFLNHPENVQYVANRCPDHDLAAYARQLRNSADFAGLRPVRILGAGGEQVAIQLMPRALLRDGTYVNNVEVRPDGSVRIDGRIVENVERIEHPVLKIMTNMRVDFMDSWGRREWHVAGNGERLPLDAPRLSSPEELGPNTVAYLQVRTRVPVEPGDVDRFLRQLRTRANRPEDFQITDDTAMAGQVGYLLDGQGRVQRDAAGLPIVVLVDYPVIMSAEERRNQVNQGN